MELSGGKVWWFPIGSDDHVSVTNDVISYELDGELRLANAMGEVTKIELTSSEEDATNDHA